MVADGVVLCLEELVLDDDFGQELNAVTVYLQVVHTDYGHNVVDYAAAETYFLDKLTTVCVHPVLEQLGLLR